MRTTLLAIVAAASLLLGGAPAAASCADDSGPDGADVVFVGTMEEERRGFSRFTVDEVRAGPDLAPEVWVRSGQEQPPWPLSLLSAVGSSTDADFVTGQQYVVGASRSFDTSVCRIEEFDGSAAPDARAPVADGDPGADPPLGPWGQGVVVAAVLALVAGVVVLLRRRRRG